MVHTYRNHRRNGRYPAHAVVAVAWLIGGLVWVAAVETFVGDSLLLVVISAPLLVFWMSPIYAHFFRRYYEIRLSDEGSCEFRGALRRSKQLRAQQIVSVERNATRVWRKEDDDDEHTLLRFQGGSLVVVQPLDGFDDFLTRLQALNPAVQVHGEAPSSVPAESPGQGKPATPERGLVNRFMHSALFFLIVILVLVYVASQTLIPGK